MGIRKCRNGRCYTMPQNKTRQPANAYQNRPPSYVDQRRTIGPDALRARAAIAQRQNEPLYTDDLPQSQTNNPIAPQQEESAVLGNQMGSFSPSMQPLGPIEYHRGRSTGQKVLDTLFGEGPSERFISRMTPTQLNTLEQLLNFGMGQLQNPTQGFEPIAQEARTKFAQETVPSIAERFSGLGAGAQGSSGFAQTLQRGATDLERGLAAEKAQYGQRQTALIPSLLGLGLQSPYDFAYKPGGKGAIPSFLGAAAGGLGQLFGGLGANEAVTKKLFGL